MDALILAAGAGTRLKPLSDELPKALIPTLDRSQLSWIFQRLEGVGVGSCWVNAHGDTGKLTEELGRAAAGYQMRLSHETVAPLGTAGALKNLATRLDGPVLIYNADILCDLPIHDLVAAHRKAGTAATLACVRSAQSSDLVCDGGRVTSLIDRNERHIPGMRYAGIAVLELSVLDLIPDGYSGLYETVFTGIIREGLGMAFLECTGYWRDVGTPRAHLAANIDALEGSFGGRARMSNYVSDSAAIGPDTHLEASVIGSNASLSDGVRLQNCVVWAGAEVAPGDYKNSIITPRQIVEVGNLEQS